MVMTHPAARAVSPALTESDISAYRRDGCLIVENVFAESTIERLRQVVDDFVEKSRGVTENDSVFDLEPGHTPERPLLRRLKSPTLNHPLFKEIMRSDVLADMVEPLLGDGVRFQGDKLNMKTAIAGSPVEWHQDFAFYPHTTDDLLAVGIALDDSTLENGCLMAMCGSHLGPVLDHHQDGVFIGAISPSRESMDLGEAVPLEVKAGDVTIHHTKLLHGSAPNRSSVPRRLWLIQYAAVSAWPMMGVRDYDFFNWSLVRGEPTDQYKVKDQTVRVPLPGDVYTGATIFELQTKARDTVYR